MNAATRSTADILASELKILINKGYCEMATGL